MNCPRDGHAMHQEIFGGVTVDLCHHCGGAWFDPFELERVDDAIEQAGADLADRLAELAMNAPSRPELGERLRSPVDPEVVMARSFADPERRIEIDRCPASGGVWLDAGELARLRERFPDQGARDVATREIIAAVRQSPEFRAAQSAELEEAATAERIVGLLSWLTPWRKAA